MHFVNISTCDYLKYKFCIVPISFVHLLNMRKYILYILNIDVKMYVMYEYIYFKINTCLVCVKKIKR